MLKFCSALRRKEILTKAISPIEFENVMLSETNSHQNRKQSKLLDSTVCMRSREAAVIEVENTVVALKKHTSFGLIK